MIQQQVDLAKFNTLRLNCVASFFTDVSALEQLREANSFAASRNLPLMLLGEGSNIVLPPKLEALVVRIALRGLDFSAVSSQRTEVTVAAGENWDWFVERCVSRNLWGLENLSLIPGLVGAAPIQNIGAYGAEFKEHLTSLELFDLANGKVETVSASECLFGYRDSIFKQAYRDRFVILGARFSLPNKAEPRLQYGGLASELQSEDSNSLTPMQVREAVCRIRRSKLPDPEITPNAGSFFKNPIVSEELAENIAQKYPQLISFESGSNRKLAAGWLIEQAGFKGKCSGPVGVYEKQALVLITNGGAQSLQLLDLAAEIQARVLELFGVELEIEPRCYNLHAEITNP